MIFVKSQLANTGMAAPEHREEVLQLRYDFLCRWNRFREDRGSPAASVLDQHEDASDYLICRHRDSRLVGMVRFIRPTALGFAMDYYVDPRPFLREPDNSVEISEIITHRHHRHDLGLMACLTVGMIKYLETGGHTGAAALCVPATHKMIEALGFTRTERVFQSRWGEPVTLYVTNDIPAVRANVLKHAILGTRSMIEDYLEARP
ncbi:MAG TPA: GNAT family N-acyltransferase [Magnetospirillum sp.]|nr:GNAT family N-acyltransferase [Magnetospirillum sp.]